MSDYSDAVLADSPLLYLRLDETSAASCANAGSLGGTATCNGTYTRNVAAYHANLGVAVTLGGTTSDYISYPDNASLDLVGNFTYECWVKGTYSTYRNFMSKNKGAFTSSDPGPGYTLRANPSRQLEVMKESVALLGTSSGTIPNDGAWHHIAVTRSGSTYTFYIDGASAGTASNSATIYANDQAFTVGIANAALPFPGTVDEAAVYSTALSGARITAHYAAAAAAPAAPAFVPRIQAVY